jgi:hypothetical protein
MFRARRDSRGDDRHFEVKAALLVLGASLGIAGMIYEIGWLVWAAIGVVAVAMILRLIADRQRRNQMDE